MGWEMSCPSFLQLPSSSLIVIYIRSLGKSLLVGSLGIVAFWGRRFRGTFTLAAELVGFFVLLRDETLVSESV